MNVLKKVKWVLAISVVFLIILATNLIDKKHFLRIEESIENIYNERLLAKELLLNVSIRFHKKELAYALNDTAYLQSKNDVVNTEIGKSLQMFDRAGATKQERYILDDLNENHAKLIQLESNAQLKGILYSSECVEIFSAINTNINDLAAEQMKEGKNQKRLANDAVNTVKLFSKMEIYMLIFLALILQFIVLYNPKKNSIES
ncbi:MAG: hypothetical protein HQ500_02050 [Flavobacteriales bacterium]|nr:hypothetical protein [Flavobacteriales bacterium]